MWKWESCLKTVKAESPGATILRNNGTHTVHWGLTSFMSENISIGQIGTTNNCSRGKCFWDWNQKCSPQTEVKAAPFKKQSNDYRPGRHPLASINQWLRSIKCNCSPEWPTNFFNGTFGHHKLLKERTQVAILCNQSQLARQGALPGGGGGWPLASTQVARKCSGCDYRITLQAGSIGPDCRKEHGGQWVIS